jgi:hypothetical protein
MSKEQKEAKKRCMQKRYLRRLNVPYTDDQPTSQLKMLVKLMHQRRKGEGKTCWPSFEIIGFYSFDDMSRTPVYDKRWHTLENPMLQPTNRRVFQVRILFMGEFMWININQHEFKPKVA